MNALTDHDPAYELAADASLDADADAWNAKMIGQDGEPDPVTPRNARFWAWINNGQVRITLRPRQSLSWSCGGPTDEGWSSEGETWTHYGDRVSRHAWSDVRDCDGRMSTDTRLECSMDHLSNYRTNSLDPDELWEPSPDWIYVESSQRDYQAEAAGY